MGALLTCLLPLVWSFSPCFGISWYFRYILYLPCIYLVISHFSKEPWFLLVGEGQDLGVSVVIATGMTLLLDFLVDNAGEYMHEYTYMYRYKYIHSYTCVQMNVFLHILEIVNSCHTSNFHAAPQGMLFFSSFHICIAFLCLGEP